MSVPVISAPPSNTKPPAGHPATRKPRWRSSAWVLGIVTIGFLAYALPPYLGLDPAQSRVPIRFAWLYPVLVTHILFGSIALVTACLQVWPWLRGRYPVAHRWSGRLYVFAGALPTSLAALSFAPLGAYGPNQQVPNVLLGILWIGTTLAGYRFARRHRYAEHREWMIRSVALAFSIVSNRPWQMVCFALFAPEVFTGGPIDQAALAQAVGVSTWMSLLGNLLIAEWWLARTRSRRRSASPVAASA
jgi:hypothetical protein